MTKLDSPKEKKKLQTPLKNTHISRKVEKNIDLS